MNRIEEIDKKIDELYAELQAIDNDPNIVDKSFEEFEARREPFYKVIRGLSREKRMLMIPEFEDFKKIDKECVMPLKEFIKDVKSGCFIDSDGFGYYAKGNQVSNIQINPSDVRAGTIRQDFNEICWYNK